MNLRRVVLPCRVRGARLRLRLRLSKNAGGGGAHSGSTQREKKTPDFQRETRYNRGTIPLFGQMVLTDKGYIIYILTPLVLQRTETYI